MDLLLDQEVSYLTEILYWRSSGGFKFLHHTSWNAFKTCCNVKIVEPVCACLYLSLALFSRWVWKQSLCGGNFFSLSPAPPQNWICSIFAFCISQPTVKHHTQLILFTHAARFVYLSWEELRLKTLKNRENNKTYTATIEWHYGKCRTEWFCSLNHTEEPGAFAVVLPPLC